MSIRAMASSSRFYNTRCFQYDKRNSEDVCILMCDSKPGSMVHHAVNSKFLSKEIAWNVAEDDKALHLLRTIPGQSKEFEAPVAHLEYMFAIHHNDLKESVPHVKMNVSTLLSLTRKGDLEPSGYYYQVMHDLEELPRLAEPASGTTYAVSFSYHASKKLQNPQAIRILIGLEGWDIDGRKTDDPFQGYAFEIFLPDKNIQEAKEGKTGEL
ncbi:hypothetical protein Tco_1430138 [Tanacetum coccineum]